MAKIFRLPANFKVPDFKIGQPYSEYEKELEKFEKELSDFLKKRNPNGKCVGETIKFQVADGYAHYMVAGLKPVELVHLPIMDAWNFQYAHRLTAKDVQEKINQQKALEKIFSKKKEGE